MSEDGIDAFMAEFDDRELERIAGLGYEADWGTWSELRYYIPDAVGSHWASLPLVARIATIATADLAWDRASDREMRPDD